MVYFIDKNLYEEFKELEETVYVDKNLYYKKGDYFFLIKANTFNIELADSYSLSVKDLNFDNFKIKLSKYQTKSIERIINEEEFCFIVPEVLPFIGAIETFKHFYNKKNINVSFINELNNKELLKNALQNFKKYKSSLNNVEKYIAVNLFDKFVVNFFAQKTPVPYIVRGLQLCIENLLNVEGLVYSVSTEYEADTAYYMRHENPYHITNKWIFMDKLLQEELIDPNGVKGIYPEEITILEKYKNKYLLKDKYKNAKLEKPKKSLSVVFFLDTYFNYDELVSVLDIMYDNLVLDKNENIINFSPLINFNALQFIETLLEADTNEKIEMLNSLKEELQKSFPYKNYKEIFKCPYCIDGKIYSNNSFYICSHCDFKVYKKNRMLKNISKRLMRSLLKNKTTNTVIGGNIKVIKLYKAENNGWYNIYFDKKDEK